MELGIKQSLNKGNMDQFLKKLINIYIPKLAIKDGLGHNLINIKECSKASPLPIAENAHYSPFGAVPLDNGGRTDRGTRALSLGVVPRVQDSLATGTGPNDLLGPIPHSLSLPSRVAQSVSQRINKNTKIPYGTNNNIVIGIKNLKVLPEFSRHTELAIGLDIILIGFGPNPNLSGAAYLQDIKRGLTDAYPARHVNKMSVSRSTTPYPHSHYPLETSGLGPIRLPGGIGLTALPPLIQIPISGRPSTHNHNQYLLPRRRVGQELGMSIRAEGVTYHTYTRGDRASFESPIHHSYHTIARLG